MSSTPPKPSNVHLLPVHELPKGTDGLRVRRGPGRPKKIHLAPDHDAQAYYAEIRAQRDAALSDDETMNAVRGKPAEVIAATIRGLAVECASLKWEREHAEEKGLDISTISSRRVDALGKLASIVIDAHKLRVYGHEPGPKTMKFVIDHFLVSIGQVARETLPPEDAERLMALYADVIGGLVDALASGELPI